jgi:CheY-like chemotaxis protein
MKYALLYDDDAAARRHSATLLKSLGYLVAETTTAQAALNATRALHFDVILASRARAAGERRALPGELSRLAPGTPTILLLDDAEPFPPLYDAFSATVTKPVTVRGLRHALEFGLDGLGARPVPSTVRYERRDG